MIDISLHFGFTLLLVKLSYFSSSQWVCISSSEKKKIFFQISFGGSKILSRQGVHDKEEDIESLFNIILSLLTFSRPLVHPNHFP